MNLKEDFKELFFYAAGNWVIEKDAHRSIFWLNEKDGEKRQILVSPGIFGVGVNFYDRRINKVYEFTLYFSDYLRYKKIIKNRESKALGRKAKKQIEYLGKNPLTEK